MLKSVQVRQSELAVLNVAATVEYGEITDISLNPLDTQEWLNLTPSQCRFIELVREKGLTYLSKVVVHNGSPALLEIEGDEDGLHYVRKLKIDA